MSKIEKVKARQVLDSRGNPTVEVDVLTGSGILGRSIVPSGVSTGTKEALELRDQDKKAYLGKGVQGAVDHVNTILAQALKGDSVFNQVGIDQKMNEIDGTENKHNLGANAILGVSMACARAAANTAGVPLYRYLGGFYSHVLPVPMMNILNGGQHADNNLDFQEFMIIPTGAASFSDALRMGSEVFHTLRGVLKSKDLFTGVGDEGGFAPSLNDNEEAIQLILEAIEKAGYKPGKEIGLGLDVAASEFFQKGNYVFKGGRQEKTSKECIQLYKELCQKYPIFSIEDGASEHDSEGWKLLTQELGSTVQLVGDDLFVTSAKELKSGIEKGLANAILIKVNQIGTVSETLLTMETAKKAGYAVIVSHRSGESEDTFIADLAVATNAGQIKTGSICRTDRVAKYNQLIRIEEELGVSGVFPGKTSLNIT